MRSPEHVHRGIAPPRHRSHLAYLFQVRNNSNHDATSGKHFLGSGIFVGSEETPAIFATTKRGFQRISNGTPLAQFASVTHTGNASDLIRNGVPTVINEKPQMRSDTRFVSIVLIGILLAAAIPIAALLLPGSEALAETMMNEPNEVALASAAPVAKVSPRGVVPTVSSTVTPTITQPFSQTYAQAVSMMLVGTLLIGIGAVVRRGI
jgi:hypothetical protein